MDIKKQKNLKILATVLFACAVLAMFIYVLVAGDLSHNILTFSCVATSVLFALLFNKYKSSKTFILIGLIFNLIACIYLILYPSDKSYNIGLLLLCVVQVFLFLYTFVVYKGIGIKIINIAIRVALCFMAYFILTDYVALSTMQMVVLLCFINLVVTLLFLLFRIKKDWLLFFGILLLTAAYFFVMLEDGWADVLGFSASFIEILSKYDFAFYFTIPGLFLIATSTAFPYKEK